MIPNIFLVQRKKSFAILREKNIYLTKKNCGSKKEYQFFSIVKVVREREYRRFFTLTFQQKKKERKLISKYKLGCKIRTSQMKKKQRKVMFNYCRRKKYKLAQTRGFS